MFRLTRNSLKRVSQVSPILLRRFSSSVDRKVSILSATDIVGEQLSTLMKANSLVSELSLFNFGKNIAPLRFHPTRAQVIMHDDDKLEKALSGSHIVIISDLPVKPDMTSEEVFAINAANVRDMSEAIAKYCPEALVNIISNHVNSSVPIAAEVFKNAGKYDPKRLFGVTTLDVVRAQTLYAKKTGNDQKDVDVIVPVVGGHSGITILPLFSQATPRADLSDEDIKYLTDAARDGGVEVSATTAKGSVTISLTAFAGATFADACLKGLNGVPDIVECSYVQSEVTGLPFFASKVRLGKNGVEETMGLGSLSDYEKASLENLLPELKQSINKGIEFIKL